MPIVHSLKEKYVATEKHTDMLDEEIHIKARNDFCYLVNNSKLSYTMNGRHIVVMGSKGLVGDCLVLGATTGDNILAFDKSLLARDDNAYVAIVLYSNGNVEGVYLHDVQDVETKFGLFSYYKDINKHNKYGIAIKTYKKWQDKKFGLVFQDHLS